MTKIQRVKKIIKWLIYSDFGESEKEIAELLGYKKSSFSQIMNEKVPLSDKFIEKLCLLDENINKVWIETGEGTSINNSDSIEVKLLKDKLFLMEENNKLKNEKIKWLEEELSQIKKATKHPDFGNKPVK